MTISNYLRPQMPESEIDYPLLHSSGPRTQVIYSENVYGLLIQNGKFWCGYTLLSQAQAEMIDSWRPILGASFLGPANDPITWYAPDRFGNLTSPCSLLTHPGEDFWIGFHQLNESQTDRLMALTRLGHFVQDVQKVLTQHANSPA